LPVLPSLGLAFLLSFALLFYTQLHQVLKALWVLFILFFGWLLAKTLSVLKTWLPPIEVQLVKRSENIEKIEIKSTFTATLLYIYPIIIAY